MRIAAQWIDALAQVVQTDEQGLGPKRCLQGWCGNSLDALRPAGATLRALRSLAAGRGAPGDSGSALQCTVSETRVGKRSALSRMDRAMPPIRSADLALSRMSFRPWAMAATLDSEAAMILHELRAQNSKPGGGSSPPSPLRACASRPCTGAKSGTP